MYTLSSDRLMSNYICTRVALHEPTDKVIHAKGVFSNNNVPSCRRMHTNAFAVFEFKVMIFALELHILDFYFP